MGTLSRSEAYTCPFVPSGVYNDTLPKGCRAHEPVCTAAAEIFSPPEFFLLKSPNASHPFYRKGIKFAAVSAAV